MFELFQRKLPVQDKKLYPGDSITERCFCTPDHWTKIFEDLFLLFNNQFFRYQRSEKNLTFVIIFIGTKIDY